MTFLVSLVDLLFLCLELYMNFIEIMCYIAGYIAILLLFLSWSDY